MILSRSSLNCGNFAVHCNETALYIGCSTAPCTVQQCTEICGFGSGEFLKGAEADDAMSTTDGRWFRFSLESGEDMVVLEKPRKTPDHMANSTFFNKVWCIVHCLFFTIIFGWSPNVTTFGSDSLELSFSSVPGDVSQQSPQVP